MCFIVKTASSYQWYARMSYGYSKKSYRRLSLECHLGTKGKYSHFLANAISLYTEIISNLVDLYIVIDSHRLSEIILVFDKSNFVNTSSGVSAAQE